MMDDLDLRSSVEDRDRRDILIYIPKDERMKEKKIWIWRVMSRLVMIMNNAEEQEEVDFDKEPPRQTTQLDGEIAVKEM